MSVRNQVRPSVLQVAMMLYFVCAAVMLFKK